MRAFGKDQQKVVQPRPHPLLRPYIASSVSQWVGSCTWVGACSRQVVNSAKFKVWLTLSVLQCLGKKCKTSDSIVMVTNIHSTSNYVPTKIKK